MCIISIQVDDSEHGGQHFRFNFNASSFCEEPPSVGEWRNKSNLRDLQTWRDKHDSKHLTWPLTILIMMRRLLLVMIPPFFFRFRFFCTLISIHLVKDAPRRKKGRGGHGEVSQTQPPRRDLSNCTRLGGSAKTRWDCTWQAWGENASWVDSGKRIGCKLSSTGIMDGRMKDALGTMHTAMRRILGLWEIRSRLTD